MVRIHLVVEELKKHKPHCGDESSNQRKVNLSTSIIVKRHLVGEET